MRDFDVLFRFRLPSGLEYWIVSFSEEDQSYEEDNTKLSLSDSSDGG